jgi:hypothetical protein
MMIDPIPPEHLIFRWYQDWVNANVTWEVGKRFDRYDQLKYVVNQAVIWDRQNND